MWRETRKLPELMIAILILGVGTVAVGLGFVIRSLAPEGILREAGLFIPVLGADAGMAALCIFTWQVYRPASQIARLTTYAVVTAMVLVVGYGAYLGSTQSLEVGPLSVLSALIYVGAMVWSAIEALIYWSALRKRMRLGLADPLVTNRVLLWGMATGTAGVGIAIGMAARHWGGVIEYQNSWVALCYAGHGFVAAIAFWLAFQPPAAYVRWVVGNARPRGASA